jgi:O-antigen ligase
VSAKSRFSLDVDAAVVVIVVSSMLWNPWGLVGRHEIRLLVCGTALALGIRSLIRHREIAIPKPWPVFVAFLAVGTLSAVFANDWRTTLWGHADRHLGLVGWSALGLAALLGANVSERGRQTLRRTMEFCVAMVSLVTIAQWSLGEVPLGLNSVGVRPTSTFGSATYTGAFLALGLPFLIDTSLRSTEKRTRILALGGSALAVMALVATQSRGAWLSAAAGSAAVIWFASISGLRLRAAGVVASVLGIFVAVATMSNDVLDRVGSLAAPTAGTAGGRLVLWGSAVRSVAERPILGWGPERTRVGLPPSLPESFEARYGDSTIPDRVHNGVLDIAVTFGVTGAIIALAAVGLAAHHVWRTRSSHPGRFTAIAPFVAAAGAHLLHLFFNFVQLDVDVIWLILVGVALQPTAEVINPSALLRASISVVSTAAAIVAIVVGSSLVTADVLLEQGRDAEAAGDARSARSAYERAVSFSLGEARNHEVLVGFERRQGNPVRAVAAADRAAAVHRDDPFFGELPALTRAEASQERPELAQQALDRYEELVRHWPYHGSYFAGVGTALSSLDRNGEAIAALERAVELTPGNATFRRTLALLHLRDEDRRSATKVLETAIDDLGSVPTLTNLVEQLEAGDP